MCVYVCVRAHPRIVCMPASLSVDLWECVYVCHSIHVEITGQQSHAVDSLLSPCGFQGSHTGPQTWQKSLYPLIHLVRSRHYLNGHELYGWCKNFHADSWGDYPTIKLPMHPWHIIPSVNMPICLLIHLPIYPLSTSPLIIHPSIHPSMHLPIHLPIHPSHSLIHSHNMPLFYLSAYLSLFLPLSIYLSIYLSIHPSSILSILLSIYLLPVYSFTIYLSICLSSIYHLSTYLSSIFHPFIL